MISFFLKPIYPPAAYDEIAPKPRKKRKKEYEIVHTESGAVAEPADIRLLAESVIEQENVRKINRRKKRAKEIALVIQLMEDDYG